MLIVCWKLLISCSSEDSRLVWKTGQLYAIIQKQGAI